MSDTGRDDSTDGPANDRARTAAGIGIGIGIGLGAGLRSARGRLGRSGSGASTPRNDRSGSRRTRRMRVPSTRCLVDIRRADGEFVVTADLPGIGGDDLSVGLHPRRGQLVIGARDSVLERVDLPWESASATKARFNNGVLEVRLRPSDAATSGP